MLAAPRDVPAASSNPFASPYPQAPDHELNPHGPGCGALLIECPQCGVPSDAIKAYDRLSYCLFLGVGAVWQRTTDVACPSCMRTNLVISGAINTLLANVVSPIIWVWYGILFAMTYRKGHSDRVWQRIR